MQLFSHFCDLKLLFACRQILIYGMNILRVFVEKLLEKSASDDWHKNPLVKAKARMRFVHYPTNQFESKSKPTSNPRMTRMNI